jgi:hypothetical protein
MPAEQEEGMGDASRVVIGMDPHKRTVTVEAMAAEEAVLDHGRFTADVAGFDQMLAFAARWPDRVWAVEGCEGIGKHVTLRLLDRGEKVVGVPAKLSARMRVYALSSDLHAGPHRAGRARPRQRTAASWPAAREPGHPGPGLWRRLI